MPSPILYAPVYQYSWSFACKWTHELRLHFASWWAWVSCEFTIACNVDLSPLISILVLPPVLLQRRSSWRESLPLTTCVSSPSIGCRRARDWSPIPDAITKPAVWTVWVVDSPRYRISINIPRSTEHLVGITIASIPALRPCKFPLSITTFSGAVF